MHIEDMAESGVKVDMQQDHDKTTGVVMRYVDEMIKIFQRSIDYSSKVMANLEEAFEYAGIKPATSEAT